MAEATWADCLPLIPGRKIIGFLGVRVEGLGFRVRMLDPTDGYVMNAADRDSFEQCSTMPRRSGEEVGRQRFGPEEGWGGGWVSEGKETRSWSACSRCLFLVMSFYNF